tara:strand:+ start:149 stop:322 length:174 start_codon:yes stop_codon:yes gene_type:complete
MKIDKHDDPFGNLERKLLQELKFISRDLGGDFSELTCSNSVGEKWKRIVIDYDRSTN